jgi:hypothetical protein
MFWFRLYTFNSSTVPRYLREIHSGLDRFHHRIPLSKELGTVGLHREEVVDHSFGHLVPVVTALQEQNGLELCNKYHFKIFAASLESYSPLISGRWGCLFTQVMSIITSSFFKSLSLEYSVLTSANLSVIVKLTLLSGIVTVNKSR